MFVITIEFVVGCWMLFVIVMDWKGRDIVMLSYQRRRSLKCWYFVIASVFSVDEMLYLDFGVVYLVGQRNYL